MTVSSTLDRDADTALAELYTEHYHALVRLSSLLVRDTGAAEEIVQDSFVAFHRAWQRIDPERELGYLRRTVVNRSRSILRRRTVADRYQHDPELIAPSAESEVMRRSEAHQIVTCLRRLPGRQREALVLRYYAQLSEAEIADAMRLSKGAVKAHTARGRTNLRAMLLEDESAVTRL